MEPGEPLRASFFSILVLIFVFLLKSSGGGRGRERDKRALSENSSSNLAWDEDSAGSAVTCRSAQGRGSLGKGRDRPREVAVSPAQVSTVQEVVAVPAVALAKGGERARSSQSREQNTRPGRSWVTGPSDGGSPTHRPHARPANTVPGLSRWPSTPGPWSEVSPNAEAS